MDVFFKSKNKKNDKPLNTVRKVDQELFNACYFGQEERVRKFIAAGGDVKYMEERDGWLGIHYAVRWGNLKTVKMYIEAGADVNGKTKDKETALHKAARWDRTEIAIYLLNKGANPCLKNSDGNKPSEMTSDPELKFLLDNFDEYKRIQKGNINSPSSTSSRKSIESPIGKYIKGQADVANGMIVQKRALQSGSYFDVPANSRVSSPFQSNSNYTSANGYQPQNNYHSSQNTYQSSQAMNNIYQPSQTMNNTYQSSQTMNNTYQSSQAMNNTYQSSQAMNNNYQTSQAMNNTYQNQNGFSSQNNYQYQNGFSSPQFQFHNSFSSQA